jgi:hypothetical protein
MTLNYHWDFPASGGGRLKLSEQNANALLPADEVTNQQPETSSVPTAARSVWFALNFSFKPGRLRGSQYADREQPIPDSVRSGASTFPESGIEVSADVYLLSREKR